jgi:hypothetical protein
MNVGSKLIHTHLANITQMFFMFYIIYFFR